MKKLNFLVSLTTNDNDYQIEQAKSAEEVARRLEADLQVVHADNDAINQSQQLLKIIQSKSEAHPDGIIFEPVGGTALPQVARAAAAAGREGVRVLPARRVLLPLLPRLDHRRAAGGLENDHARPLLADPAE